MAAVVGAAAVSGVAVAAAAASKGAYSPLFSGGLALLVVGALTAYLKDVIISALQFVVQQFAVTVTIQQSEPAYRWLIGWMTRHKQQMSASITNVTISKKHSKNTGGYHSAPVHIFTRAPTLYFVPGSGSHLLYYKGHIIWVRRDAIQETQVATYGAQSGMSTEKLTLMTFGKSSGLATIRSLTEEAMNYSLDKDKGRTIVYTLDRGQQGWQRASSRPSRALESVILDSDVARDLVEDAKSFLRNEEWYSQLGVPYRRSYLFHGHPGSGKTSFISALAGELGRSICMLSLNNKSTNDVSLCHHINSAPANSIILIEDIDAAFPSRDPAKAHVYMPVTFSGVLNAIDGVAAQRGNIFCMTTNHINRLDTAILRPGRIDRQVEFGLATKTQCSRMWLRFFPNSDEKEASKFADTIGDKRASMAELQGHFLVNKDNPIKAMATIDAFIKQIEQREKLDAEAKKKEEDIERRAKLKEAATEKKLLDAAAGVKSKSKRRDSNSSNKEESKESKSPSSSPAPSPSSPPPIDSSAASSPTTTTTTAATSSNTDASVSSTSSSSSSTTTGTSVPSSVSTDNVNENTTPVTQPVSTTSASAAAAVATTSVL